MLLFDLQLFAHKKGVSSTKTVVILMHSVWEPKCMTV